MDIHQMHAVCSIARNKSISRAAEEMYVTQQSLSGTIRTLENEIGFKIFNRTARGSVLTPEGSELMELILPVVAEYDDCIKKIDHLKSKTKNHVNIATAMGILEILGYDFNLKLLHLLNEYYGINGFSGYEYTDSELEENMVKGLVDLAVSGPPIAHPELEYNILHQGKLCVYMHKDHPLAKAKTLTYADLKDQPFVTLVKGTKLYGRVIAGCTRAGFKPNIIQETSNTYFINWRLHNNGGINISADLMPKDDDIVRIPLEDRDNKYTLCLVYSKKAFKEKRMKDLLKVYSNFIKENLKEVIEKNESGLNELESHWSITE